MCDNIKTGSWGGAELLKHGGHNMILLNILNWTCLTRVCWRSRSVGRWSYLAWRRSALVCRLWWREVTLSWRTNSVVLMKPGNVFTLWLRTGLALFLWVQILHIKRLIKGRISHKIFWFLNEVEPSSCLNFISFLFIICKCIKATRYILE